MSEQNHQIKDEITTTMACETSEVDDALYDPVEPRIAGGKAPVLIEIICERVHCVLYDYAINTVDMIVDIFGDKVDIQTVIRQGDRKNAQRFLDLCERAGKMLTVPTILINGEVAFTSVPHPNELEKAIEAILEKKK
ncbi:MAG TPA: hypothetical protein ENI88_07170 [Desulfobulbus sp.]|nr:hypothetical protein [Desulfobulbus sp.]